MITFSRSMLVTGEAVDSGTLRLRGVLEDHIYAMEIQMDVRVSDGVILQIQGSMKRYTNPVCPKAVDVLQEAVGISLREEGWVSRLNREIGRKGCQHFAEILAECGRCLNAAWMAREMGEALRREPSASPVQIARSCVQENPEAWIPCIARPGENSHAH